MSHKRPWLWWLHSRCVRYRKDISDTIHTIYKQENCTHTHTHTLTLQLIDQKGHVISTGKTFPPPGATTTFLHFISRSNIYFQKPITKMNSVWQNEREWSPEVFCNTAIVSHRWQKGKKTASVVVKPVENSVNLGIRCFKPWKPKGMQTNYARSMRDVVGQSSPGL